MKVIAAFIIFTLLPLVSFSSDRYGNLVETKDRHGDDTTCGIATGISLEHCDIKADNRLSGTETGTLLEQKMLIDTGDLQ